MESLLDEQYTQRFINKMRLIPRLRPIRVRSIRVLTLRNPTTERKEVSMKELQETYSNYSPNPLSAADFVHFAEHANRNASFEFLVHELPTRWMQILKEMRTLPIEATAGMVEIQDSIEKSIEEVLPYTQEDLTIETIARYNIVLEGLLVRHRHVVDEVAMAVLGYKDGIMVDGKVKDLDAAESKIHYFLDRFFTNILSATLLINQHLFHFHDQKNPERYAAGVIQTTNVTNEISQLAARARKDCQMYYGVSPEIEIMNIVDNEPVVSVEMVYVPDHLERIIYELLRNALRATVEKSEKLYPITVLITKGKTNVCIRISDRGGGASLVKQKRWGAYLFTSPPKETTRDIPNNAIVIPLAGYGYGIPISVVHARYLGGDVNITSIEHYGTSVYVYLPAKPDELSEVLPIFTGKTEKHYAEANKQGPTWVSGKRQDIVFQDD